MERDFIQSGHPKSGCLISCGGGLPVAAGMIEILKSNGKVFTLWASPQTIFARTKKNSSRPLLQTDDPFSKITKLMSEREPKYRMADKIISTDDRSASKVAALIQKNYLEELNQLSKKDRATSTNLSLENDFRSTNAGIDLGYIDWAPEMLGGDTNIVVGKMKKQWDSVNDVIWDGDTNPEGAAIKSKIKLSGVTLMPSAGYYVLDDNGNDSFSEDSHVGHAQLAAKVGEKTKVGISYYGFENPNNAGESMEERMFEIFGETAIPGTPVTVFASHVTNSNADASGDDDNAFSIGAKAKLGNFKLGYEFRDLGVNAVNSNFDNSDFLSDSKGSIFKAAYKIDNNFSVGATYYTSDSNIRGDDTEVDLLHLDLKAKF